jgi:hypothetical protein
MTLLILDRLKLWIANWPAIPATSPMKYNRSRVVRSGFLNLTFAGDQ